MTDYSRLDWGFLQVNLDDTNCDVSSLPNEDAAALCNGLDNDTKARRSKQPLSYRPLLYHNSGFQPRQTTFTLDFDGAMPMDAASSFASTAAVGDCTSPFSPTKPGVHELHSIEHTAGHQNRLFAHSEQRMDELAISSNNLQTGLTASMGTIHDTNDCNQSQFLEHPESKVSSFQTSFNEAVYRSFPRVAPTPTTSTNPPAPAHYLIPNPPPYANICAVQNTDNPRVFVFRCTAPRCRRRIFSRWYDFNRHYNGTHAVEKTVFWCPVAGCIRGEDEGHRAFPRRDKMMDHALKIHGLDERNAIFRARDT